MRKPALALTLMLPAAAIINALAKTRYDIVGQCQCVVDAASIRQRQS
jgi:hypothetical protein